LLLIIVYIFGKFGERKIPHPFWGIPDLNCSLKTESLFLSREAEGLARRSFSNRCSDCIRSHDQGAKSSKLEQLGR
jgi:hypothetical protein